MRYFIESSTKIDSYDVIWQTLILPCTNELVKVQEIGDRRPSNTKAMLVFDLGD